VKLREENGITRQTAPRREYEAVEELPMGYQLQLDFGEKSVRYAYSGRYIKVYFVVFTLTHSRYMWGIFQEHPFTSTDLVHALYGCFEYIGGKPRQLVYDQDSIIVVSENGGDIIHTQAFAAFLSQTKLEVGVCRKSDPETKGLIEASVKYVKGNFMENRYYLGIDTWNQSFEEWLVRVSKRRHGTTMKRPVDMYEQEREHLLPLFGVAPTQIAEEMDRNVRPDNTVCYKSNRYSVPYGTYTEDKKVYLAVKDGKLEIMNQIGEPLATHELYQGQGKLIRQESHRRDRNEHIKTLLGKTVAMLGVEFKAYLETLVEKKPRYVKEQLDIVLHACQTYGREIVLAAEGYCQERDLYSANDLRDAAGVMVGSLPPKQPAFRLPVEDERYHVAVEKRALSIYAEVAAGSGVSQ
jgi:hypothetical protein